MGGHEWQTWELQDGTLGRTMVSLIVEYCIHEMPTERV